MSDVILETRGLTKNFGVFTAVDDVDLTIERGETIALIGPNGAGKTTVQNMITGQLDVSEGEIYFNGEEITGMAPYERARRGIIRKFQVTRVYQTETVLENMRMAMRGRGYSTLQLILSHDDDIDDRISELLQVARLQGKKSVRASDLSHGEQQWLEIIMAVSADPVLLLLDEPTSGMSVKETNDTVALIDRIREQEGISILVIEHDMDFIRKVSNNLAVLHRGEIIAEGTIEDIENDEQVQRVYIGRE